MPQKKVPRLVELCLRNTAVSVARHGQNFILATIRHHIDTESYSKEHIETLHHYECIQRFFSVRILEEIKCIHYSDNGEGDDDSFTTAANFFTKGESYHDQYSMFIVRSSTYLLFNEHTFRISIMLPRRDFISRNYIDQLRLCKNLRSLTLQFCIFSEEWLRLKLHRWTSLSKLDLLFSSCDDYLVRQALVSCPQLKILQASGNSLSNECLFYLCQQTRDSHYPSRCFELCRLKGLCCSSGKNLVKLILCRTKITEDGVACALQHLPSLKCFVDGGLTKTDKCHHFLAEGIRKLRSALLSNNQSAPVLNLQVLIRNSLNDIEGNYLPYYNTEALCERNRAWFFFGNINSARFSVSGISNPYDLVIDLKHIVSVFTYRPTQCFFTEGRRFRISDMGNIGVNEQQPSWVSDLKQIHLCDVSCLNGSVLSYFTKLLRQAVNVISLTVSGRIAEQAFVTAMGTNIFQNLETVSICDADLSRISLNSLINRNSQLKKITLLRCRNFTTFSRKHKHLARVRNCHLDIVNDETINHVCLIKTHLMQVA